MANGWGGPREGAGRKSHEKYAELQALFDETITLDDRREILEIPSAHHGLPCVSGTH
jgi:hypothetical protein